MPSSRQTSDQPLSPGKKPLVPPGYRENSKPSESPGKYVQVRKKRRSSSDNESVTAQRPIHDGQNARNQSKVLDSMKARAEFTRLVLEQHEHVSEQNQTLKTLDDEMEKYQAMAHRREKSAAILKVFIC